MRTAVRCDEARDAVLAASRRQPPLRLPLEHALGHVLAHELVAPWPLPSWTAASMDGYAVRSADVRGASRDAPVTLPLVGGGDAGDAAPPPLAPGTAWRVATGGRVPDGADSVVRVEDTAPATGDGPAPPREAAAGRRASNLVTIHHDRDAGRNVRPAGGDVVAGSVALAAGTFITPGVVALLAALGESHPMVHRKPRVAIVTSGEEVVPLDERDRIASGERIADVNGPMLAALVRQAGGVPVPAGLARDDAGAIAEAVARAADADMVITAGGISVGERDHVPAAMQRLGAELVFRRVRVRPGGPTTLARLPDGRPWLALPGNPVSAFVTFHVFAAPGIRRMSGDERRATGDDTWSPVAPGSSRLTARLAEPVPRDATLEQYLRVTLSPAGDGGLPWARLTGNQGSWVTSSIAQAEGLAVIPAGEGEVTEAEVLPL